MKNHDQFITMKFQLNTIKSPLDNTLKQKKHVSLSPSTAIIYSCSSPEGDLPLLPAVHRYVGGTPLHQRHRASA